MEEEDDLPVVHVFELEPVTSSYVSAGIFRGKLERRVPFPIVLDLDALSKGPGVQRIEGSV
ncbi:hypothetical protein [Streptomyces sp. CBMA123]|uniref:hypothetical protein n=1 Tax=Streptomyces sp. CBMA123 TaxID=1896313 RepID=UPI0016621498|nr:hypothetical protein [Streptomyces sp. CBMA123]MBD0692167.1 hypothetical protein [Streptomyces sp. CBMA123]